MLLERDELTGVLQNAVSNAAEGAGSLILVAGEAGAGKTSLVQAFVNSLPSSTLVIEGACDPLTTPRPLSPLHDFAADPGSGLDDLPLGTEENVEIFQMVLGRLRHTRRTVLMVIEDIHWADEATLDFLRYVGRRIGDSKSVVLATYRDDEVGADHPLRAVLGQLIPLQSTQRLSVPMLSQSAVATLASDTNLDPAALYKLTDGNAFYVTEVIASKGQLPETVQEAVLARVAALEPGPREVVHTVSIAPRALEVDRALLLVGGDPADVDVAVSSGVILGDGRNLRFRHELARSAVEQSVPPAQRHVLHSRTLGLLLEEDPSDHARIAHHANQAQSPELIVAHAPAAAEEAAQRGARREAVAFYEATLDHVELLDRGAEASNRKALSQELGHLDRIDEAVHQIDQAIVLLRASGPTDELAEALTMKQGLLWGQSRIPEGWEASREAIELLRPLGPSRQLARSLYRAAHHHMLARHAGPATEAVNESLRMARDVGDTDVEWLAQMILGTIEIVLGNGEKGMEMLDQSRRDAADLDNDSFRSMALSMLGSGGGEARLYAPAIEYLQQGIEVARSHDEDYTVSYNQSWLSRIAFEQGRWDEAVRYAESVLNTSTREAGISFLTASGALGRVRVRRGDPGGEPTLRETIEKGRDNELQHVWSPLSGLAEWHWLRDDHDAVVATLSPAYQRALDTDSQWARGELGYWMWRAGAIGGAPDKAAEPFALQIEGDWRAAADRWHEIGCPYEVGLSLSEGDQESQLEALAIFDALGAKPMGDRLRASLRQAGVESIPRGPSKTTQTNIAGLTNRQTEVLDLMGDGLSNAEIAERLFISKKTVEHHVSAIFSKLGVDSRVKAVAALELS